MHHYERNHQTIDRWKGTVPNSSYAYAWRLFQESTSTTVDKQELAS